MLSLHRSHHGAPAQTYQLVTPPWFARPTPGTKPAPPPLPQRSLSPMTNEDEDDLFYREDLIGYASEQQTFKNRYPASCYKKPLPSAPVRSMSSSSSACSTGSCEDQEIDLPSDPRTWMREDVQLWIRGLSSLHGLPSVQSDRFLMNGKALCLMSMEMFCQRVPLGGKMLYKDFQLRLSMAMYHSSGK